MKRWTLEDETGKGRGYLTIYFDGERSADVFPFAKGVDEKRVRERAKYIVDTLNDAEELKS